MSSHPKGDSSPAPKCSSQPSTIEGHLPGCSLDMPFSLYDTGDQAEEPPTRPTAQEQKETDYSANLFKAVKKGVVAALVRMGSASSVTDSDLTKSAATSTTGLPTARISATTSTPAASVSEALGFYRIEEEVGRETRNIEFKAAYSTLRERGNGLFELVGKYVCGFLNSTEGGTLYFGVDDSGKVRGSLCSRGEEDKVRQLIDQSIRTIEPSVFPTSYSVHFSPVMEKTGYLSDNLQVLEIKVYPTKSQGRLYDFKGHIYMRRDGSLQGPLKGREVQEWIKMHMETVTATEHAGELVGKQLQVLSMRLAAERDKNKVLMQQVVAEQEKNEALTKQLEQLAQY